MMREFSEYKVLNIVNVELKQLKMRLLLQGVTLYFTYTDDNDDQQTITDDPIRSCGRMAYRYCRPTKHSNFFYSSIRHLGG